VTYLAVGAGDPAWDANPPPADRGRTALTAEVFRVRVEPGVTLTYDATSGRIDAGVSIGPGQATGTLRELGLFGGDASPRPGTGTLVNHSVHPALVKGEADTLVRELRLTLAEALAPGARDLVGGLLARRPGLAGITHVALGTSAAAPGDPPRGLAAEAYRKPLAPGAAEYDPASHTFEAGASFEIGEGPAEVREAGLFGGTATGLPGSGLLVAREAGPPIDRRVPKRLERRFRLVLVARTDVAVPGVTGQALDAARAGLAAAELQVGRVTERETEANPAGTVVEQSPQPTTVVNEGMPVALVVAIPPTVVVPEIVGEPEAQARTLLRRLGFEVPAEARVEQESTRPAGTVLASSPPPGARIPKGTAVALTVAVPMRVSVPDVRGRTPAVAGLVLRAEGLEVAPEPHPTQESGTSPGTVVLQDPDAGADVAAGTAVQLTLATPWTIVVPELQGKTTSEAEAILAAAAAELIERLGLTSGLPGLSLGAVTERADPAAPGTILEQLPAAGERASLYAAVDVVVSALATRTVPALVGLTQTGAVAALAAAELAQGAATQRPAEAAPGTVVAQDPGAGVAWPRGARVAITVAIPRRVAVPDLVERALDAAREALAGLGLALGTATTRVEPGAPGVVLSQDPPARRVVAGGSAVNVVVRAGVPSVVGMSEEAAGAALDAAGVPIGAVRRQEADGPPGLVLAQQPPAGTAVGPDTRMTLTVSIRRRVEVPAVVRSSLDDARRALEAAGLTLDVAGKAESDEPEGSILTQDPQAGSRVERGTAVLVTIAVARPRRVDAPNVVGLVTEAARTRLAAVGLTLEVAAVRPTPGGRPGTIVEQNPGAGTSVDRGTVVRVVVASADESTEVPEVRRLQIAEATAVLQRATLRLQVTRSTPSVEREGMVLTQDPLPGARAPLGSVVSVVVSAGGLVVVPAVVRQTQASAVTELQRAGLSAEIEGLFNAGPPGIVLGQDPQPGAHTPRGSVVLLTVSERFTRPRDEIEEIPRRPGIPIDRIQPRVGDRIAGGPVERFPGVIRPIQ
jgi:beta-lactam-binding protein with PASTA domain